jgi:preprotein translocase subunit SecA
MGRGFGTVTIDSGYERRRVALTPETVLALQVQRQLFKDKFGRDPRPDEPIFFNPDADVPEPMTAEQQRAHERAWEAAGGEELRLDAEARLEEQGMIERIDPKRGRNEQCPCGSGLKWKHCHGR